MDDFDATTDTEEGGSSIPEEDLIAPPKRGPGRPKGSKNRVPNLDDPEGIPEFASSDEPPRKRRGRPPGSKNKGKSAKLPIPPTAIKALGGAPYMLAGQLYSTRTGRSLDFTNPEQVRAMYEASLQALEQWLAEAGVEAPAWLVYAGTTAMCIGAAISVDQMKLKWEKDLAASSAVRRPVPVREAPKPVAPVETASVQPIASVPLDDSDKRASTGVGAS